MVRVVVRKRQPIIVGVVGSDTSLAKKAITLILSKNYFVRETESDRPSETEILLTIIGVSRVRVSFVNWIIIFFRFLAIILRLVRYPDVLVLEMNVDNFEGMENLMNWLPIKVGVAARISSDHKEQGKFMTLLQEGGFAIFNVDDRLAAKMAEKTKAKIITYGFGEGATLLADNPVFHKGEERGQMGEEMEKEEWKKGEQEKGEADGFSFKLNYGGNTIPVRLPRIASAHHIEPVLAAVAVAIAIKMNLVEIVSILES